jgi:hypothetical protein
MLNYFVGQRDRIQSELTEEQERSDALPSQHPPR